MLEFVCRAVILGRNIKLVLIVVLRSSYACKFLAYICIVCEEMII